MSGPIVSDSILSDEGKRPLLVAFDLDDTLAPSKSPVEETMAGLLLKLLDTVPVAIISGGRFEQFRAQVVERLIGASEDRLGRLHLLPTCGTQYYRFLAGEWQCQYSEDLTPQEKTRAIAALEDGARELGLWSNKTWGEIIEDRASQITFSALGQAAPVDEKAAWDPSGDKKLRLREWVASRLPDLEVRAGGSTSVDITRRGIDKAYGMRRLAEVTGISLDDMLFVGDRLDVDGNDYPVKALGVRCIAVENWQDTAALVGRMLPALGRA